MLKTMFSRAETDGKTTKTSNAQKETEDSVHLEFQKSILDPRSLCLKRDNHIKFLLHGLQSLSTGYQCLDASRVWCVYWILHSLDLLGVRISDDLADNVADFLALCQKPDGGFGGNPEQDAHLAPTYAAVNAIYILATEKAYKLLNREKLKEYIKTLIQPDGSVCMHVGGETDIRGAYCALSAASLSNIDLEIFDNTAEYIVRCQSYEGGFGGNPGLEAHGGYTFCGLAGLAILKRESLCDIDLGLHWLAFRQLSFEGGFQGRTNKLVDACYSFWQGASFPLAHYILTKKRNETLNHCSWLFHQEALQKYVLICSQNNNGGMVDKPGKQRDMYHTCYALSGLSVAQHFTETEISYPHILGPDSNVLKKIHPVFNITVEKHRKGSAWFSQLEKD